jgi:beta-xylosidase
MERFFALQTLIEAVAEDLPSFTLRLEAVTAPQVPAILQALRTRIFIQPLAPGGRALTGACRVILENDLPWEGHLIEGVWITQADDRYYLFYAGNDFSTARYGLGVAVAKAPDGPYAKSPEALLASGRDWWGPGHPSVVRTADGWRIFVHAFAPGRAGYKRFRALLSAPIRFEDGRVSLGQA